MLSWKPWSPRPFFEQKRVKLKNQPYTPMGAFAYNISNFFGVVDIYGFIGDHMRNFSNFFPSGGIL